MAVSRASPAGSFLFSRVNIQAEEVGRHDGGLEGKGLGPVAGLKQRLHSPLYPHPTSLLLAGRGVLSILGERPGEKAVGEVPFPTGLPYGVPDDAGLGLS